MVRKRKKQEEEKPWCFYCDREFNDENDLILHQKNKHFKCGVCNKRLVSAKALTVHSLQVHKVVVTEVPDSKRGREDPTWEIFGSQGIPPGMQRGQDPPKPGSMQHMPAPPYGAMPPYGGPPMPPYGGPPVPYGAPPPPHYYGHRPPYGGGRPMPPYGAGPPRGPPPPYGGPPPHPYGRPPPPQFMPPPRPGYMPPPPRPGPLPPPVAGAMAAPPYTSAAPVAHGGPPHPAAAPTAAADPKQPPQEQPKPATCGGGVELVWADEELSMEERRASLSKYSSSKVSAADP